MSNNESIYPGFSARMLAHNIDLVILLPFFYLISYYVVSNYLLILYCFLFYVFYHSVFELSPWKGTPGKKLQKMKVIFENGQENPGLVVVRNLFKCVSAILLFIGFVMSSWDKKRRALHDRMVGCVVTFYA